MKLRDYFSAKTGNADEDRDFADAFSRRRGDLESVLHHSVAIDVVDDLPAQDPIYEIANLDLVSTCEVIVK